MHLLALLTQLLHFLGEAGVFSDEVAHQPRVPVRLLCLRSEDSGTGTGTGTRCVCVVA